VISASALALLAGSSASASADFVVDLLAGTDSNPLRVQSDGPDGWFSELRLAGAATGRLSPRAAWRASGVVSARGYESSSRDAGTEAGSGRLGLDLSLGPVERARGVLSLGLVGAVDRSTFTDRASGEVYVVEAEPATLPPTLVAIPDRFDAATVGAYVDADLRLGSRVAGFVASTIESVDFLEEYGDRTALDSLDYRALTLEPGLRIALHANATLRCSVAWTDLEYEEQAGLDASGEAIAGTTRSYRASEARLAVSLEPAARWALDVGVRGGPRRDAQAGYYDLDSIGAAIGVRHRPSWRTQLQLAASTRDVDYVRATVIDSTSAELRGSRADRVAGRFDYDVRRPTTVYGEVGVESIKNNDPVFAHDRRWIAIGLRYRP
jgi:hypothetical protein